MRTPLFLPLLVAVLLLIAPTARADDAAPAAAPAKPVEEEEEVVEDVEVEKPNPWRDAFDSATWKPEAMARVDRVLSLHFARTSRPKTLTVLVAHRTYDPFARDTFDTLGGYDGGNLKVGLGLRYGIIEGLEIGLYRLNNSVEIYDTYEADAKYQFLHAERHYLDMAVRAGMTWFHQPRRRDASGGFAQLLISREFWNRLHLGTGLLWHSNSSNPLKNQLDRRWTVAVQGLLEIKIIEALAWNIEVAYGFAGYAESKPFVASSLKYITNRHTFAIVAANSQMLTADGVITGSNRRPGDFLIGFNIVREIEF